VNAFAGTKLPKESLVKVEDPNDINSLTWALDTSITRNERMVSKSFFMILICIRKVRKKGMWKLVIGNWVIRM
jgi:hypothetical protein